MALLSCHLLIKRAHTQCFEDCGSDSEARAAAAESTRRSEAASFEELLTAEQSKKETVRSQVFALIKHQDRLMERLKRQDINVSSFQIWNAHNVYLSSALMVTPGFTHPFRRGLSKSLRSKIISKKVGQQQDLKAGALKCSLGMIWTANAKLSIIDLSTCLE